MIRIAAGRICDPEEAFFFKSPVVGGNGRESLLLRVYVDSHIPDRIPIGDLDIKTDRLIHVE